MRNILNDINLLEETIKRCNEFIKDEEKSFTFKKSIIIDEDYIKVNINLINDNKYYDFMYGDTVDMTKEENQNYIMDMINKIEGATSMVALLENMR